MDLDTLLLILLFLLLLCFGAVCLSGCASLYHRRRRHLFARKSTTIHKINRTSKTEWDGKAD